MGFKLLNGYRGVDLAQTTIKVTIAALIQFDTTSNDIYPLRSQAPSCASFDRVARAGSRGKLVLSCRLAISMMLVSATTLIVDMPIEKRLRLSGASATLITAGDGERNEAATVVPTLLESTSLRSPS